jgi:hypothetical protein
MDTAAIDTKYFSRFASFMMLLRVALFIYIFTPTLTLPLEGEGRVGNDGNCSIVLVVA